MVENQETPEMQAWRTSPDRKIARGIWMASIACFAFGAVALVTGPAWLWAALFGLGLLGGIVVLIVVGIWSPDLGADGGN